MERDTRAAVDAQAELFHQWFLGLQLMVSTQEGPDVVGAWMFRLFRAQHEAKFLSSFAKLGLDDLPHAVACARYHVLSNSMGGVGVEYMEESERKAWVRFRYPRWMYAGAAICGIPVEASRGFLRGWYGQNGVSLGNPRLRFVCVSEDMTGQFGLCGYFEECAHDLSDDERLAFAPDEAPPAHDPERQPRPPAAEWNAERLAKAQRNYAMEYLRNGLPALVATVGRERALELARRSARLIGLQQYRALAEAVGGVDGGPDDAARFLAAALRGMGDEVSIESGRDEPRVIQGGLRVVRGLGEPERNDLLSSWIELWRGAVHAHRELMEVQPEITEQAITWTVRLR